MTTQGHKHSASLTVNQKAQLANAYNELGKELSSQKIRVVGNYTLGKVIGEGEHISPIPISKLPQSDVQAPLVQSAWVSIA